MGWQMEMDIWVRSARETAAVYGKVGKWLAPIVAVVIADSFGVLVALYCVLALMGWL
jgi:hypothetical protein